jgi:cAMP-dependent protein kinase regulator
MSSDGSNYDTSESEDEDDEVGAMVSFEEQQKILAMGGGRRRGSVSAESTQSMVAAQTAMTSVITKVPKTEEQTARIEKAIAGNLLFEHLETEQKEKVYESMFEKTVGPGKSAEIIKQGDEGDYFYIIDSGLCAVAVNDKEVAQLGAGKSFGELALMYFAPRAATIKAVDETILWCMDRMTFRSFLLTSGTEKRDKQKDFLKSVELLKVGIFCAL